MYNMKGGRLFLRKMAGSFIFVILCAGICTGGIPGVTADVSDHAPVMFRADPWHSGVNDDGGTRPSAILLWRYCRGGTESSPAVADGTMYIGGSAFDAETGALLWNQQKPGTARDSSPAIVHGVVYSGDADNNVYALDAETGAVLWNYTTNGPVHSSPAIADGVVYIGSSDGNLYALDAGTGVLLWNYTTLQAVRSSPAVANGIVYVGDFNSNFYALDAETGGMLWNYTMQGAVSSSPAVADGVVYVGSLDNKLYAFDAYNGTLIWNYTTGDRVYSSPAVADGVVYFGSSDDNVYALDAETGALLWNYTTGGSVLSSPTIANGVLYVGSYDENLYALDAETGLFLWNYPTRGTVRSSPAVANGVVYIGSEDCIYAIGYSPGPSNLMLGKSGPVFYENASLMEYTLSYRNQGLSTAGDVVLTDYLPSSVEFVSGTGDADFDNASGTVTWYLWNIPPYSTGSQVLTVRIPSSVPYGTVLNNTADIVTSTPESQYDDNTASALTTLKRAWTPSGCSISPSVPDPWGNPTVSWDDTVIFSYNQTTCPPETPVNIRIHIDDGGPDITAPMTGGPQYWSYSTTFQPRYGTATVTYETPGCILTGVTFPFIIEPAGYVYDTVQGLRIEGADVWLQWLNEEGEWVNVPTGLAAPPMQPDINPLTTDAAGQYQWDVAGGSYRVYVEAEGYTPAASTMVNSPRSSQASTSALNPQQGRSGRLRLPSVLISTLTGAILAL
jgi:conserved repeat domain